MKSVSGNIRNERGEMMRGPIYKPTGRALEYSPLALNLYNGCLHSCMYCYAPAIFRRRVKDFRTDVKPRENLLENLINQCNKIKGDPRDILLCFGCDPYQPLTPSLDITRQALLILENYEMRVQILTKGGMRASRDFDILARNNWKFGTTLLFYDDLLGKGLKNQWEPNSASITTRIMAINTAKEKGIYTWISVEPVIDPTQALHVILELRDLVDHFKVGKINYHQYIEKRVDWGRFAGDVYALLRGKDYYIKKDLLEMMDSRNEKGGS